MVSGCGMTAPCDDISCIIILRCSRCSELSSANAPKATSVSAITNPPILRMVTRRSLPIVCLQFDDDVAAIEEREDPQPQCNEAQRPEQRREFRRKVRLVKKLIRSLMQRNALSCDVHLQERIDEPGHQPRSDKGDQRIHAV